MVHVERNSFLAFYIKFFVSYIIESSFCIYVELAAASNRLFHEYEI